ncbi:tropomyosin-like [Amphiura filiformis]|uniref:tropomyosin-like n=1 Tax=Amphiura filiformis TaxID=82378 RepID=UPI003B20EC88
MDTIKKKMLALKAEKENALDSKDAAEAEMRAAQEREEKANDQIKELQGRIKQLEEELDTTGEKLHETEVKCEEALKAQSNAEAEVGNLSRRLQLEDEELERAQARVEELSKKLKK